MQNYIDLTTLSDDDIRDEFFRRLQCYQYPSKNVVLRGPPATTTKTQANRLAYELCSCLISPPVLLKNEVQEGGNSTDNALGNKETFSDNLLFEAIEKKISKPECRKGLIFFNFPQTLEQAKRLDNLLLTSSQPEKKINKVYNFDADDETIIKRIAQQSQHISNVNNKSEANDTNLGKNEKYVSQNSDDTQPKSFGDDLKNSLRSYREKNRPLVDYYSETKVLNNLNANEDPDTIWKGISSTLFMD